MFFRESKEKKLKMIWEVEKDHKKSYLVGTAHFFPYSFKNSLREHLKNVHTVLFEGPLEQDNMRKVVDAGSDTQNSYHIFDELGQKTIAGITQALKPACRDKNLFLIFDFCKLSVENPIYEMLKGMKPWLAFFTIWSNYLKKNGWKYSVDLEGYLVAQELSKKIVFLETIEEQIKVLQNLSHEKIIHFLKQVDRWHIFAEEYVECYLAGDLEKLKSTGLRFPSRHHTVIDHRDEIFYERMREYLKQGDITVFVGAPHVRGMSSILLADGYQINGPWLPQ